MVQPESKKATTADSSKWLMVLIWNMSALLIGNATAGRRSITQDIGTPPRKL